MNFAAAQYPSVRSADLVSPSDPDFRTIYKQELSDGLRTLNSNLREHTDQIKDTIHFTTDFAYGPVSDLHQ